jgi:hypothetical protein
MHRNAERSVRQAMCDMEFIRISRRHQQHRHYLPGKIGGDRRGGQCAETVSDQDGRRADFIEGFFNRCAPFVQVSLVPILDGNSTGVHQFLLPQGLPMVGVAVIQAGHDQNWMASGKRRGI